jgi:hypothetical protein
LTNSAPSRYLHAAIAQSIFLRDLCARIFIPYYLPTALAERQVVDEIMTKLPSKSPPHEAIFRRVLLCASDGDKAASHERILVTSTVQAVLRRVKPLLSTPQSFSLFKESLESIVEQAIWLWKPLQRCPIQCRVENDPGDSWDMADAPAESMALTVDRISLVLSQHYPILSLFPRVVVGDRTLCQGRVLWSGQDISIAASFPSGQNVPSQSHTKGKRTSSATKSLNSREESLPSPASLRKSFNEHMSSRNSGLAEESQASRDRGRIGGKPE